MGARVSVNITEEDGSRLRAVQAGEDWKGCVEIKVHRPIRLDRTKGLILRVSGVERVHIFNTVLREQRPGVHEFFTTEMNLLEDEASSSLSSSLLLLDPGSTYIYPFCLAFPAQNLDHNASAAASSSSTVLPSSMHFRDEAGAFAGPWGRVVYGSVHYEATVWASSFQRARGIQVLPSSTALPAAAFELPRRVGPVVAEEGSRAGWIHWGAAANPNIVVRCNHGRDGDDKNNNTKTRLYVSLVNESTTRIQHLRVELLETVSLSLRPWNETGTNSPGTKTSQEVLWRLERAPLDPDLEIGHKMAVHVEEMISTSASDDDDDDEGGQLQQRQRDVSSQAVLDDLVQYRPQPIEIVIPYRARSSHLGQLTRVQHQLRLTLVTNKKNSQMMVPLWIV